MKPKSGFVSLVFYKHAEKSNAGPDCELGFETKTAAKKGK